ncbi:MAG: hypothetical protein DRP10_00840 [Candidatus Aenigmatarchaeota archaeon]|nr:MAG: hypothetical protein DRP10_00840 [Candidatus Aenigmarchaeota archaeon]
MRGKILGLVLILFLLTIPVFGLSTEAIEANNSLREAEYVIKVLKEANLSTERVSDIYLKAKQLYEAQVALEKAGGKPDYSEIFNDVDEIKNIKEKAFLLMDELNALKLRIKDSDVNTSEAEVIYKDAVREFEDERYEQCEILIEKTYAKLSELESKAARIAAFYEAMSKTFENFLRENFKKIIAAIAIILITLVVTHNRIKVYRLKKKLELLELRKVILKELIARTQKDYFEKGIIGEDTYHIRIDKFGELIRDVNRQIPLIKEKIARVEKPEKKLEKIEKRKQAKIKEKKLEKIEKRKQQQAKIKERVEALEEEDLDKITERLLELEKKMKKPKNPIKRIAYEIDIYRRRKKIEKKFKEISK